MLRTCLECGSQVPETSSQGYCPKCLLKLAEQPTETVGGSQDIDDFSHQLPRAFGSYQLVELLGEGGMGIVFKAFQTNLNRTVALKMLRSGLLASKEELKRFHAEAQAAGRLKHPNIVTVHEIGEHEGRLFFSMDCVQGRSLAKIVGRTPLSPRRAAGYTMIIAQAVHYAHTQGVLHRDLKPANVLVDEQDRPHITDFGLAKEVSRDAEMTRSGAVLGTPSYMSPEQAAGHRKLIKTASDIYSLGAILYDLLTGRPPFRADSPAETLRQVIDEEPAPVRLLNVKVPRDLETICLKCLAKDPARRYESAQLLAEDLGRFLGGEPILARRAGRAERAYRWAKRYPTMAALQLAGLVMVGLLGYVAHFSYADAREQVEVAPDLANGLAYQLDQIGHMVSDIASNPTLVERARTQRVDVTLQKDREKNELLKCLDGILERRPESSRLESFENWLLLDTNGLVRANWTTDLEAKLLLEPLDYRDYFRSVTNFSRGHYVSKAYKSQSDDRFKVAVSAPVLFHGQLVAVLGRMIAYKDLAHETARTRRVVIAEMDPDPTSASVSNRYAVIWHPKLDEKTIRPIRDEGTLKIIDQVMSASRSASISRYRDPAESGLWVARMARVPGTRLIAVYQIRDRVREARIAGGVLLGVWSLALTIWAFRRRRRVRTRANAL